MKIGMKMISALLVVVMLGCAACGGVKVPIRSAADLKQVKPDDEYDRAYRVTFSNGQSVKLKDEDIVVYRNMVGVRLEGEKQFRYYSPQQISEISRREKRHAGMGALIGLGAGAAAGAGVGFAVVNSSCSDAEDSAECRNLSTIIGVGIGVSTAIIGTAVGAAIGAAIRKKKKVENPEKRQRVSVSVSPQLYGSKGLKVEGAGLGISGRF